MTDNATVLDHPRMAAARAVATMADGKALIDGFLATMEELLGIVERETALVQKGWLAEAGKLNERKSELAGCYLAATLRLRASAAFLNLHLPDALRSLRARHDGFPGAPASQPDGAGDRACDRRKHHPQRRRRAHSPGRAARLRGGRARRRTQPQIGAADGAQPHRLMGRRRRANAWRAGAAI